MKKLVQKLVQISIFLVFTLCLLAGNSWAQSSMNTMSQVNSLFDDVVFRLLLEIEGPKAEAIGLTDKKYFLPLSSYIENNFIGKGNVVKIDETKLKNFISIEINANATRDELGVSLIKAFRNGEFNPDQSSVPDIVTKNTAIKIGGFLVAGFDYRQDPDGSKSPYLEFDQSRIFLSADFNRKDFKNRISFFAELNPVAEESIHQINEVSCLVDTNKVTIYSPEENRSPVQGGVIKPVNFERLYMHVDNVINAGINITLGQFRNPFGLWGDYTSRHNNTSTKNNQLVNGFSLRKIDLGIKLDKQLKNGIEFQAAIVNGRDDYKVIKPDYSISTRNDFTARIGYDNKTISLGASSCFADFQTKRIALGVDYGLHTSKLSVSGEVVYQRNTEPGRIFNVPEAVENFSSYAGYLQFDLPVWKRFHLYGMYEFWDYRVNKIQIYNPEIKVFHGVRYNINNSLRWTIIEYGHMFHKGYDKGEMHLSTQLEFLF